MLSSPVKTDECDDLEVRIAAWEEDAFAGMADQETSQALLYSDDDPRNSDPAKRTRRSHRKRRTLSAPPASDEDDPQSPTTKARLRAEQCLRDLKSNRRRRWAYLEVARRATTGPEYKLLGALMQHTNPDLSNCFPGAKLLAGELDCTPNYVHKLLMRLEGNWIRSYEFTGPRGQGASGRQFIIQPGRIAAWKGEGWEGPIDFSNRLTGVRRR